MANNTDLSRWFSSIDVFMFCWEKAKWLVMGLLIIVCFVWILVHLNMLCHINIAITLRSSAEASI